VAVGSREEVVAAPGEERLDLRGAFLCPGLVDAHAHVMEFGLALERPDLAGAASLEEALTRVKTGGEENTRSGSRSWILGRGWDQNPWPGGAYPHRKDLDRITGDRPAALNRVDGHALWVNSRALEAAGITAATADPPGGRILRDENGEPSGILIDNAMNPVDAAIGAPDDATRCRAIRAAADRMVRAGLTGVHDMGMDAADLAAYRGLAASADLGVRVYAAIVAEDPELERILASGPDLLEAGGWFRLGMVKFFLDGALGSRGAALLEPYADARETRGLLVTPPRDLARGVARTAAAGFQAALHAIGDRANRLALDTWDFLAREHPAWATGRAVPAAPVSGLGPRPPRVPPVRIEHAQVIHPGDLDRFAALGAAAGMQPVQCAGDLPWMEARLGPSRLAGAYAWGDLLDRGVVVASGSDFPVESHDPRIGLVAALTRARPDGTGAGTLPGRPMTRSEALVSFTAAGAYLSGDLHRRGTLSPGKDADLAVFDRNLLTCRPSEILEAKTLMTMIGGRIVWRDAGVVPVSMSGDHP